MVTRVIHLSFLYTAALLLQSGRPQLMPNQHYGHDEYHEYDEHDGFVDIDTDTGTDPDISAGTGETTNQDSDTGIYGGSSPELVPVAVDPPGNYNDIDTHDIKASVQSAAPLDHETLTGPAVVDDDIYYDPGITVADYGEGGG